MAGMMMFTTVTGIQCTWAFWLCAICKWFETVQEECSIFAHGSFCLITAFCNMTPCADTRVCAIIRVVATCLVHVPELLLYNNPGLPILKHVIQFGSPQAHRHYEIESECTLFCILVT